MTKKYLMHSISMQAIQELWKAGKPVDFEDDGFAFDRAIRNLNVADLVDQWDDSDWQMYEEIHRSNIKTELAIQG